MAGTTPIHRREFLERAAVAGGVAASLPAASWARVRGANEVLRIGLIGCGPRGQALARRVKSRGDIEQAVVLRTCDVYRPRLQGTTELLELPPEAATMEYREILDDSSVDAVIIATPDHWHAKMTIEALEAGKAVFVETPLTHTIEQAVEVREAVRRTGGTLVVGAQRCAEDTFWQLRESIAQQRLGKITWSQTSFCVNGRVSIFARPKDGPVSPQVSSNSFLWWDRWLGVEWGLAPEAAFDDDRFFRYQKYYDYSNGLAGEVLFGALAPMLLAIGGRDGEEPRRAVSGGGLYNLFDGRETPDQLMTVLDFPREHSMVLVSSGTSSLGLDTVIRGTHGMATIGEDGAYVQEDGAFYPEFRQANRDRVDAGMSKDLHGRWIPNPPAGEVGYDLETEKRQDVIGNFLAAVRGEASPYCGVELGFAAMVGARMMSEALRTNSVMLWDRDSQTVAAV